MAAVANRQAELAVRHGHTAAVGAVLRHGDGKHRGRGQRRGDELRRVLVIFHNIDFFAAKLLHNVGDPRATRPNAGADRVHIRVMAEHRQLGTGTGLTGNGLDLYGAVVDLRHLSLKQALDQIGVRTGDHGAGALLRLTHIHNIDLDMVALADDLVAHLLGLGQHRLRLADAQRSGAGARIYALYQGAHQLLVLALELLHHLAALAVTDALANDVARRLGRNAPKLFGVQRHIDIVAHADSGVDLPCLFQHDLTAGLVNIVHGNHLQPHLKGAGFRVDVDGGVIVAIAVFTGSQNCLLDFIHHKIDRYAALLLQQGQSVKNLVTHLPQNLPQNRRPPGVLWTGCSVPAPARSRRPAGSARRPHNS